MLKPGRDWYEFKDEIIESLRMYSMSERFGWTPDQVRSLSEEDLIVYSALMRGSTIKEEK